MQISYETEELRNYYRFPARALASHGPRIARTLATRFADLRAAQNADELKAFEARECEFAGLWALAVPITEQCSLIVVPSHPKRDKIKREEPPPIWAAVTRVKVVAIVRQDEQG